MKDNNKVYYYIATAFSSVALENLVNDLIANYDYKPLGGVSVIQDLWKTLEGFPRIRYTQALVKKWLVQ